MPEASAPCSTVKPRTRHFIALLRPLVALSRLDDFLGQATISLSVRQSEILAVMCQVRKKVSHVAHEQAAVTRHYKQ